MTQDANSPPWGLRWRASYWYATFVVGLGVAVDLLSYSVIIPILPFHLEKLGYDNVAARVGWLVFAYSGGLAASTIPAAMLSEKYQARWTPLVLGLLVLIGAQIMFMEVTNFAAMCIARILQGISSSAVWVVGLALLSDQTPKGIIGRQLGTAMSGLTIGLLLGPATAGSLYAKFGIRGPFIFSICFAFADLLFRLVIIERKVALKYGFDPQNPPSQTEEEKEGGEASQGQSSESDGLAVREDDKISQLSLLKVLGILSRSGRALTASFVTLIYGIVFAGQEAALTLHLSDVWNQDSEKVGIIFLAAVIPTLFANPIAGWLSDKYGTEWLSVFAMLLSLPWWILTSLDKSLAFFIVMFAIESFFTSAILAPITAELDAVAKQKGIGYGHVYASFNFAYGVGSAIGPIISGQIYDHLSNGWAVICYIGTGLLALCIVFVSWYTGDRPLGRRVLKREKTTDRGEESS